MTVMNVSRVVARVNIPVARASWLRVGMPATVTQSDTGVESQGRITVITAAVEANSTTVQVWIDAANPNGQLKPGSTAQAAIVVETIAHALVIPKAAILPSQEGAPAVESVGAVNTGQTVRDLPLNGRDWTSLAALQPGVTVVRSQNSAGLTASRGNRGLGTFMAVGGLARNRTTIVWMVSA